MMPNVVEVDRTLPPAGAISLRVHLADRPLATDISWTEVVDYTEGYAASDLALLADNAARTAMRTGDRVRERHLLEAVAETESSLEPNDGDAVADPDGARGDGRDTWYHR